MMEERKCPHCESEPPAEQMHVCPRAQELGDDDSEYCDCCEECTKQCFMDI